MKGNPDVYGPNGLKYNNDDAKMHFSKIGISIVKDVDTKETCNTSWYTEIHVSGKRKDGKVVIDTRAQEPNGDPIKFRVGNHEVLECWDLAMTKLKPGQVARVECPSYLAWGSSVHPAPLDHSPIPANSDIDFYLEVLKCNNNPKEEEARFELNQKIL